MKFLTLRVFVLVGLTGFLFSARWQNLRAQSCPSCRTSCPAEDSGETCINYTGNDCGWDGAYDACSYPDTGCPQGAEGDSQCCWIVHSPIVIDVTGAGFKFTDDLHGVRFPIESIPRLFRVSWPAPESHNAWLVLDRNENGHIDNGSELFGNYTEQPNPPKGTSRNGFLALRTFDSISNGGNGDGMINSDDAVFSRLRLWDDLNHDGLATPDELFTLPQKGVYGLDLDYKLSRWKDQYGNAFRYRARVFRARGVPSDRWAYDVYLKTSPVL